MVFYVPANLHSPTYRPVHAVVGDCLQIINRLLVRIVTGEYLTS